MSATSEMYVSGIAGAAVFSLSAGVTTLISSTSNLNFAVFAFTPFIVSALFLVPVSILVVAPWRRVQTRYGISMKWDALLACIPLIIYWLGFYPNHTFDLAGVPWRVQHAGFLICAVGVYCGSLTTSLSYFYISKRLHGLSAFSSGDRL